MSGADPTTLLFRDFLEAQERTALTPVEILRMADMEPDPWQTEVLSWGGDRLLLNCSRQSGKSTVAAARAVGMLMAKPGAQVLMTAPSQRQSGILFRAAIDLVVSSGLELNAEAWNKSTIELPDGGRIMAVPGTEQTIRGVPALDLLVIDEASRVTDDLMVAVMPMIATTGGTIMALSVRRPARKAGSSRRPPRLPPAAAAGRTGRSPRICVRGSHRTTWTRCLIKWARRYSSRSTSAGSCWETGRCSAWGRLTPSWPARKNEKRRWAGSCERLYPPAVVGYSVYMLSDEMMITTMDAPVPFATNGSQSLPTGSDAIEA